MDGKRYTMETVNIKIRMAPQQFPFHENTEVHIFVLSPFITNEVTEIAFGGCITYHLVSPLPPRCPYGMALALKGLYSPINQF